MSDRVFIGSARLSTPDHVEIEYTLRDLAAALLDLGFAAFEPDAGDVRVIEQFKYRFHVYVELVDSLFFDALDSPVEIGPLLLKLGQPVFELVELVNLAIEVAFLAFELVDLGLESVGVDRTHGQLAQISALGDGLACFVGL